jgi:hypothetical protein
MSSTKSQYCPRVEKLGLSYFLKEKTEVREVKLLFYIAWTDLGSVILKIKFLAISSIQC